MERRSNEMGIIGFKEKNFEDVIENYLITSGGYIKDNGEGYDTKIGFDTQILFQFIKNSQPKAWERYCRIYGEKVEQTFITRLNTVIDKRGNIDVLRKGFSDRGIRFQLLYFPAETNINPDIQRNFNQNIATCVRQLHFSEMQPAQSLDIVLFINGFPLVTLELKNQLTSQSNIDAQKQYMRDRNPNERIFRYRKRALIHFAVDNFDVSMTTKIAGEDTFFLPFNQGTNGPGEVGGAGNPYDETKFPTAYLWEEVLSKTQLIEIIQRFIHHDSENDRIIFPRFHQLDVVRKLVAEVKNTGSGENYLIQHSAGSGKSNSIAWLAHQLSSAHRNNREKIFDSVIVVTDRRVLDNQLQETIYQFDHVLGVVEKIDGSSLQLKDALNAGVPIIITTLQKFPEIFQEVTGSGKQFAIIVDEAHSSQSGESAKKLKTALADTKKPFEELSQDSETEIDGEDILVKELLAHGKHENLSFFAFTATPKNKTLELFGVRDKNGKKHAYHIYSMKQAIEEGFILDVLQNYTTYNVFYKIMKKTEDDPEIVTTKATKAIARFSALHAHNISQKVKIIAEYLTTVTEKKINGKAKAMLVTSSRIEAVRYFEAFQLYFKSNNIHNIGTLVAFSGKVLDGEVEYTETKMNSDAHGYRISENRLPKVFNQPEMRLLIVAEKYQTGFDEPLLHTMFVDKKLNNIKAVQTLSRLNRRTTDKEDTFILDFSNKAIEIKEAFQPYYEDVVLLEDTEPNIVYDLKDQLEAFQIFNQSDINLFQEIYYSKNAQKIEDMAKLIHVLKPARDRVIGLEEEREVEFKAILASFIRLYSFITQLCRFNDGELHVFYTYAKLLLKILPKDKTGDIDLDDALMLEYYKAEESFRGAIVLEEMGGELSGIKGTTGIKTEELEPLSEIIKRMNEKFATQFAKVDVVMDQLTESLLEDSGLINFALENDEKTFSHLHARELKSLLAKQHLENSEFFDKIYSDEEFMENFMVEMSSYFYKKAKQMKK